MWGRTKCVRTKLRAKCDLPRAFIRSEDRVTAWDDHENYRPGAIQAKSWEELKWVAMKVLGPESHQLGICYGVAEGLVGMVRGLLDLLKLVVLEAFYEELHRPYAWTVTPMMYLEAKAADRFLHPQIEKAHKQVVGLLAEARKVAMEPGKFFPEFWSKQKAEYKRKWERYKWLAQHPSVVNEFQAGRMEGQILLEVLMLVATVVDGVGLALKGLKALGEIPELLGLVEEVGGLKELETVVKVDRVVEGAEGAAGAGDAAKAAGAARRARSLEDIEAYRSKYQAKEAAAREAGENRAAGGYKAKVTEAVGERAATEHMAAEYPDYVMDQGFKPGSGFDQVYTKYGADGNPSEIMIVEAKGPGAELFTDAAKGPQMSQKWVENTVNDMQRL